MLPTSKKCFFCNNDIFISDDYSNSLKKCKCMNCGEYAISEELFEDIMNEDTYNKNIDNLYLISGYLREINNRGEEFVIIDHKNIDDLFSQALLSKSLLEKMNLILVYIFNATTYFSEKIIINTSHYAICYSKNEKEYLQMLQALCDIEYLKNHSTFGECSYSLTVNGFLKAEDLKGRSVISNQCFVAMMFSEEMIEIFNKIKPLIMSETNYDAIIIFKKEHNNNICDEIISEIRRSKFLIADFTGQRGGVYFEAGFAYGLGLPVIWTCKRSELKELHFDINHYNFILWETAEDLCSSICKRILATIV
ncbi:MAG: nucleoside 2-deoxyribosyltransferase [Candidatus Cloacimonetes bacterium]|nr:nucleoside 2-deoxyribosyltransferase [Candidatus Cloacimonadota bacterium]